MGDGADLILFIGIVLVIISAACAYWVIKGPQDELSWFISFFVAVVGLFIPALNIAVIIGWVIAFLVIMLEKHN